MRTFLVFLATLSFALLVHLTILNTYATHIGSTTLVNECYLESQHGNCEDNAIPSGCLPGNTGADCCAQYQASYQAAYPGITGRYPLN